MANQIYKTGNVELVDGTDLYITPLKIKYLREFMDTFDSIDLSSSEDESIMHLVNCSRIAMKQYAPWLKTVDDVEDSIDLDNMYKLLEFSAGIKLKASEVEDSTSGEYEKPGGSWDTLDLVKLETEVFLLGIWKDYEDLETSLSLPELVATLNAKREDDYTNKKFLAAIQGVDLDKESGHSSANPWEAMKARVFSKGKTSDPDDIVSMQGQNAKKAGFGIGMGLDYEDLT